MEICAVQTNQKKRKKIFYLQWVNRCRPARRASPGPTASVFYSSGRHFWPSFWWWQWCSSFFKMNHSEFTDWKRLNTSFRAVLYNRWLLVITAAAAAADVWRGILVVLLLLLLSLINQCSNNSGSMKRGRRKIGRKRKKKRGEVECKKDYIRMIDWYQAESKRVQSALLLFLLFMFELMCFETFELVCVCVCVIYATITPANQKQLLLSYNSST